MRAITAVIELKACEDDGITAYVPRAGGQRATQKKGRFSLKNFSYDAGSRCLPLSGRRTAASDERTLGRTQVAGSRSAMRAIRKAICRACPLRAALSQRRRQFNGRIGRWEHEDVLERHRARMQGAQAS